MHRRRERVSAEVLSHACLWHDPDLPARPLLRRDWETSGHRTRPDRCVMNLRNLWKVQ
jgi:hypothetical protein